MKRFVILALVALWAGPALAEEVALEPTHLDWSMVLMPQGGEPGTFPVRYEKISAPEGVTAPEGTLRWGRLHVGKKSHLLCMVMKGRQEGCLWLDRDGDRDLKEETPVKTAMLLGRLPSFRLKDVPGEFEVAGKILPLAMNLQVVPMISEMQGLVFLNTVMTGSVAVDGQQLDLRWFPGGSPYISPAVKLLRPMEIARLRIGGMEITASEALTLADGKLRGSFTAAEAADGVACSAPDGLGCIMVNEKRKIFVYMPGNGKVHLPRGKLSRPQYLYGASTESVTYNLAVLGKDLEVEEGLVLKDQGTVSIGLEVKTKDGKAVFSATMTSHAGNRIQVFKDGVPLPALPSLRVLDPEGNVLAKHRFTAG
jgi:hypothetical protein